MTGLSRTTIYDWSADGRFPRPIRLSERAVRWIESEVADWMAERIEQDRAGATLGDHTQPNHPKEERA